MRLRTCIFFWLLLVMGVDGALAQQATAANDPLLSEIRERERLMRTIDAHDQQQPEKNTTFSTSYATITVKCRV